MKINRGNLYVIAAPSGTGKTSLVKALVESTSNIVVSISHTTRPKRPAEKEGINYYFVSDTEFRHMIETEKFLEYAVVFNHLYGTSSEWVEKTLLQGKDVILEIDWQGSEQIKNLFPTCIGIFILPPSLASLSERLITRNQDAPDIIQQRLADAKESIAHIYAFDYIVMNDNFNHALDDLKTIVNAGRLLQKRQTENFSELLLELSQMRS